MKPFILAGRAMPWSKVMGTSLLTGSLDIILACLSAYLQKGTKPDIVLKYIASGVFGKTAFSGGAAAAGWGLLFHFIIATCFTITIFLFYRYGLFPLKNRIITAIVCGVAIWATMHYIIVPLTDVAPRTKPVELMSAIKAAAILIVAIGIPAVFIAHKHFAGRKLAV